MKDEKIKTKIIELREMMKTQDIEIISDQEAGVPQPPLANPRRSDKTIPLTKNFDSLIKNNNFWEILNTRTSKRKYLEDSLTLNELASLLWSTQGVKSVIGKTRKATIRTVPSAGARHPFETYLFINRVEGIEPGLYHYLALEHELELVKTCENQVQQLNEAFCEQIFFANAPIAFVWSVVPYRSEWRYTVDAHKYALIDIGHVCQNLYLASEAIGCGSCAIGAYDQNLADQLLGFDTTPSSKNDSEFVIYAASVGKIKTI